MKYGDREWGIFQIYIHLMQFVQRKNKNQITTDVQINIILFMLGFAVDF
jgi:hypothetical protein